MAMSLGYSSMSAADWQKQLATNNDNASREKQARDQAVSLGKNFYTWTGADGSRGTGSVGNAGSGSQNSDSLFGGGGGSSSSSSNLFGSSGSLFGSGGVGAGLIDQAKDLANFRLGLDERQGTFSAGLRETEAQNNFGRNFKLADQQIVGQTGLENLRQNATTQRQTQQLTSQQLMQQKGFDQQNQYRAQSASLALRGLQ